MVGSLQVSSHLSVEKSEKKKKLLDFCSLFRMTLKKNLLFFFAYDSNVRSYHIHHVLVFRRKLSLLEAGKKNK